MYISKGKEVYYHGQLKATMSSPYMAKKAAEAMNLVDAAKKRQKLKVDSVAKSECHLSLVRSK